MIHRRILALAVALSAVFGSIQVAAQPGIIEEIHIQGRGRMSEEAFLQAFGIRAGDPFDVAKIQSRYRVLWDLGLFTSITIEAEDAPQGGKALIIKVVERPTLSAVTYEDNKVLTQTQIEDQLAERSARLELGRPIDQRRIFGAEATIREMLGEKGYVDARVTHELRKATETSKSLHFFIRPGGKTKIKTIDFVGNEVYGDRKIKQSLSLTKAYRWYWPWSSKALYHPVKWDQDVGAVRDLYQNSGYLDVDIKPPVVDVIAGKKDKDNGEPPEGPAAPIEPTPKQMKKYLKAQDNLAKAEAEYEAVHSEKPPEGLSPKKENNWHDSQIKRANKASNRVEKAEKEVEKAQAATHPTPGKRWVALTVFVNEGQQYTTGEVTVEGNSILDEAQIISLVPLREGSTLSNGLLKIGIDRISRVYGDRGYLYANVVRQIRRHDDEPVADIHISIQEDEPYFVETIEFLGNTSTHDKVMRREFVLNEGDLFSRTKLDISARKLNQLGYVRAAGEPIIHPEQGENRVKINVPVQEEGRNQIQVGGGYSGVDGAFFTGMYSTRNFMGRGQIFSLSMQIGGRSSRYALSFVEPWFLNRPYTLGFSVFSRDVDFGNDLSSSGQGFGIVFGKQVGVFSSARINYNWERITSTDFSRAGNDAESRVSSITPSYNVNKINNPYRPTRGWNLQTQMQIAGGPIGGDTAFLKPIINYTGYRKGWRKSYIAVHGSLGWVREWADGTTSQVATVDGVPRFERFWIGGDTLGPRIFETRTVTPRRFVYFCRGVAVDLEDCGSDELGQILDVERDPVGLDVTKYDQNLDGILDERDLVELGGDRFYLLQAELVYPLNETFELALFVDVGNSLFEDQNWGFEDVRISTGIEMRFILPVFPAPLRLIYGIPLQETALDSTSNFTFAIGRSF